MDAYIPPGEDDFKYDLSRPVKRYNLPEYLEEISGLSYYGNGKMACIQDEKANIYVFSLEKEEIIDKQDFGDDADYEDIVIVKKTAYVLRNNGTIYRVKDFRKKDRKELDPETFLQAEGIYFRI